MNQPSLTDTLRPAPRHGRRAFSGNQFPYFPGGIVLRRRIRPIGID